jgi:hypothetical protein
MKNEKDIIDAVVAITAISHSFSGDKKQKQLARLLLTNYYDVCCFFLNEEDNYSSGLHLGHVQLFIEKYDEVMQAICN